MANPQLLTGARGLIQRYDPDKGDYITIAFATDITVNIRQGVRTTYVVGRMNAGAIDSLTYDVDVSIGRVIPVSESLPEFNEGGNPQIPSTSQNITAIDLGLEKFVASMNTSEDLQISLQDKVTGQYVSDVKGCRFAGRSHNTNAGDITRERLNFVGIYDAGNDGENAAPITGYEIA